MFKLAIFTNFLTNQKKHLHVKNVCVLVPVLILIALFYIVTFKHGERINYKARFIKLLHTIPHNERRYFVWKYAFDIMNRQTKRSNRGEHSMDHLNITELVGLTISNYKVQHGCVK